MLSPLEFTTKILNFIRRKGCHSWYIFENILEFTREGDGDSSWGAYNWKRPRQQFVSHRIACFDEQYYGGIIPLDVSMPKQLMIAYFASLLEKGQLKRVYEADDGLNFHIVCHLLDDFNKTSPFEAIFAINSEKESSPYHGNRLYSDCCHHKSVKKYRNTRNDSLSFNHPTELLSYYFVYETSKGKKSGCLTKWSQLSEEQILEKQTRARLRRARPDDF